MQPPEEPLVSAMICLLLGMLNRTGFAGGVFEDIAPHLRQNLALLGPLLGKALKAGRTFRTLSHGFGVTCPLVVPCS